MFSQNRRQLTEDELHCCVAAGLSFGLFTQSVIITVVTFWVSRRRRKMYCGHARLCVCLCVRGRTSTLLHGPGCNLGGMVEAVF